MDEAVIIARTISKNFLALSLSDTEVEAFASIFIRKEINKGEFILKEGEVAQGIYFVQSGLLRFFYYKEGRDITEHFVPEQQAGMSIISMFRQEPTKLMVESLENGVIYLIPYFKLIEISEHYPQLTTLLRKMLEGSLIMSQEKADSWRFETARERYNRFLKEFPGVAKRASVNHIASYLLMTPESLSRVRSGVL